MYTFQLQFTMYSRRSMKRMFSTSIPFSRTSSGSFWRYSESDGLDGERFTKTKGPQVATGNCGKQTAALSQLRTPSNSGCVSSDPSNAYVQPWYLHCRL